MYHGFEEVKDLLDVGGSMRTSPGNIISMYPYIYGNNFDLPNSWKHFLCVEIFVKNMK